MLGISGYVFEDNRNLYSSLISSLSHDFMEWSATETADLTCYIQAPIATKVEITAYVQSLLAKATPLFTQCTLGMPYPLQTLTNQSLNHFWTRLFPRTTLHLHFLVSNAHLALLLNFKTLYFLMILRQCLEQFSMCVKHELRVGW